jgi:hypothetical protein
MSSIKELIKLVNSQKLYDAKEKLDQITKDKLKQYKDQITKNLDIFNKSS